MGILGSGKVPVGVDINDDDFDTVEKTGGSKTHTLTIEQMPTHTHTQDSHNHTQAAHNHSQNSHSHTINHDHSTVTSSGAGGHSHNLLGYWRASGISSQQRVCAYTEQPNDQPSNNYGNSPVQWVGDHTHSVNLPNFEGSSGGTTATNNAETATNNATTATNQNTGSGEAHNNLQPYITCYMWKRTA